MNPDFAGDLIVNIGILCAFLLILGTGGFIADYIFPLVPPIQRLLDSLPEYEDDEEVYAQYLEERRARRMRRARRKERRSER